MGPIPLCLLACALSAPVHPTERPAPRYRLESVRHVQSFVGSAQARETLAQRGFVVTEQQFASFAEAYSQTSFAHGDPFGGGMSSGRLPKFITVDSALDTFHLLLESAAGQLAQQQGALLSKFSARLRQLAVERQSERPEVYGDLAAFAGVALALQAENDGPGVARVLECIRNGRGPQKVLFFGLPLTPQRYRVGPAGKAAMLPGHLAARQWYATSVFRLNSAEETERAVCLALLVDGDKELRELHERLTAPYEALLGSPQVPTVREYTAIARKVMAGPPEPTKVPAILDAFRREAAGLPDPSLNDQWLSPEQRPRFAVEIKGFRLLPPPYLFASAIFQHTAGPAIKGRSLPSGLDVFAVGPLSCPGARRILRGTLGDAETIEAVFQVPVHAKPAGIHGQTLELTRTLQAAVPESAPAVLRTPAWRDKQVWTSLGVLAQQHHAWTSRSNASTPSSYTSFSDQFYGHRGGEPLGYVSPYPEFFRRLAGLTRQAAAVFRNADDQETPDAAQAGRLLIECLSLETQAQDVFWGLWGENSPKLRQLQNLADAYFGHMTHPLADSDSRYGRAFAFSIAENGTEAWSFANTEPRRPDVDLGLLALAHRWLAGQGTTPADQSLMRTLLRAPDLHPQAAFSDFAAMCDTLASIADKQLLGKALNHEEHRLVRDYGDRLAQFQGGRFVSMPFQVTADEVMLNEGPMPPGPMGGWMGGMRFLTRLEPDASSARTSADGSLPVSPLFVGDAAVAADKQSAVPDTTKDKEPSDTQSRRDASTTSVLYAGTARLEALYVIIEINGQPVLHRGAVMSYREFPKPSDEAVTDQSWAAEVRQGKAASPPDFTASFRQAMSEDEMLALVRTGQVYGPAAQVPSRAMTRAMFHALSAGQPQDVGWFVRQVSTRATQDDTGELLALARKLSVEFAGPLAVRLAALDWAQHQAAVWGWLHSDISEHADAAAYLLARHPERIEIAKMTADFSAQKPRTRRLYCYLAGKVRLPKPPRPLDVLLYPARNQTAAALIVQGLKDESDGVRYQAAIAALQRGWRQPQILDRLVAGVGDKNQAVAAAMVHAIIELKTTSAAPAMLARLEKIVRGKPADPEQLQQQLEALQQEAQHEASYSLMVLAGQCEPDHAAWPQIAGLAEELLTGVGKLRCTAAKDLLQEIVKSRPRRRADDQPQPQYYGLKALEALAEIDPKGKPDLLLGVALDRKIDPRARSYAIGQLALVKDPAHVEKLLPLVDEETPDVPASEAVEVPDSPMASPFGITGDLNESAMFTIAAILAGAEKGRVPTATREKVEAQFRAMLRGDHGPAALNALAQMGVKDHAALLQGTVADKSAPMALRVAALSQRSTLGGPSQALRAALPFLTDAPSGEGAALWEESVRIITAPLDSSPDKDTARRASLRKMLEPQLRKALHGDRWQSAYQAMLRLHGKAAPDLLTALARDGSLPGEVRVRALRDLNGHGDLACVRELLPLLDDATIVENQTSLCQHAAAAIAALLGHAGGGHFYGAEPALQADTLQKVRQAIFDAGIK